MDNRDLVSSEAAEDSKSSISKYMEVYGAVICICM